MILKFSNIADFFKKHIDIMIFLLILLACYMILFHQSWSYSLIDVDETRYASMAREILQRHDWTTMYLNHDIFYEKPPLYFWLLAFSYKIFGGVSEFAARFPIALIASMTVFITYYFGKKTVSRSFGLISSLILLSTVEFIVLTRVAILDMLVTFFIVATIFSGFTTYFCKQENKKYFWWLAYLMSAFAVLAKGLPGVFLPFGVLFITSIVTGNLKEMFKPLHILVGAFIFFAVSLPWHIAMFNLHGMDFVNMYFIKQHFARFLDTNQIGRVEPFYYFVPVLFVGFLPWSLNFIGALINGVKNIITGLKKIDFTLYKRIKLLFSFENDVQKLLLITSLYFLLIFAFFSTSHTKLPTYILPLFPSVALLTGYYWYEYICCDKNCMAIKIQSVIWGIICVIASIGGFCTDIFAGNKLTSDLNVLIYVSAVWVGFVGIFTLYSAVKTKKIMMFLSQFVFIIGAVLILVNYVFPVVINAGERDLINYASYVKPIKHSNIIAFGYGVRPSVLFYSDKKVDFIVDADFEQLKQAINNKNKSFVIVKTKDLDSLNGNIAYHIVKAGKKYTLITDVILNYLPNTKL